MLVTMAGLSTADAAPLRVRACKDPLKFKERKIALRAIDNVCGDTWCEGDYSYDFRYLRCCGSNCQVFFYMGNPEDPARRRYVSCKVTRIRDARDLVTLQRDVNGKWYGELKQKPYDAISRCIEGHERALYNAVLR
jgi:hypothetical protein